MLTHAHNNSTRLLLLLLLPLPVRTHMLAYVQHHTLQCNHHHTAPPPTLSITQIPLLVTHVSINILVATVPHSCFNRYRHARRFQLWEACLAILHCSGHNDSLLVRKIWDEIIAIELTHADTPQFKYVCLGVCA